MKFRDIKLLWGRAANRCSFPECRMMLTTEGDNSLIGENAHIVARSPDGPRGDSPNSSLSFRPSTIQLLYNFAFPHEKRVSLSRLTP
jgi:hypothetical protein